MTLLPRNNVSGLPGEPYAQPGRWLTVVGFAGLLVLLVLSLVFWKERASHSDASLVIVEMVNVGGFITPHNRFICLLYGWLPALLVKSGASLRAVAMGYSFAYALLPLLMALVAQFIIKSPWTTIKIVVYFTIWETLLFYYPVSDLQMGCGVLILYDALAARFQHHVSRRRSFIWQSVLLVPLIAFAHPLCLITVGGWLCYRLPWLRQEGRRIVLWLPALLTILCAIIKAVWLTSYYEQQLREGDGLLSGLRMAMFESRLCTTTLDYLWHEGFVVLALFALGAVLAVAQRRYWNYLVMLFFSLGLFSIVLVRYAESDQGAYQHYYEHLLRPIAALLAMATVGLVARSKARDLVLSAGLAIILTISISKILNAAGPHTMRVEWMTKLMGAMEKQGIRKGMIPRSWAPNAIDKVQLWNSSKESLMLSSLDGPQHTRTLFMYWPWMDLNDPNVPLDRSDVVLVDGGQFPQGALNPRYFGLDTSHYIQLEQIIPKDSLHRWMYP